MLHRIYKDILHSNRNLLIVLISLWISIAGSYAQSVKDLKTDGLDKVQHYMYREAIEPLSKYLLQKPGDKEVMTSLAISYYHINNLSESIRLLDLLIENTKTPEPVWLVYKAFNKHRQNDFTNAIRLYKQSLQLLAKSDPQRSYIKDQIMRCATGLELERKRLNAVVENIGDKVNTIYDEYAPVLSPNYNYCSDMYSSILENGTWGNTEALSYMLNGPRHENILGFTNKGSVMYFFKGFTHFSGDILVDTFKKNNDQVINPQYYESPLKPEAGDNDLYFVNDSTIIFSSARTGGFGGKDLYITIHTTKGWTIPSNLGDVVNSDYDEFSPYLARDGKTLYFSSNNQHSLGGYDIFKSIYDPKKFIWSAPENLGIPINSADDDSFFRLSTDGHYAYFSSDRSKALGERDIFSVYFNDFLICQEPKTALIPAFLPEFVNYSQIEKKEVVVPKKEITPKEEKTNYNVTISPIYYEDEYNILTSQNIEQLDKLAELMIQHPILKLVISCHTAFGENANVESYFSLKRAEQAGDYLIKKGVNSQQILDRGCGFNYPLVKMELKTKEKSLQSRFNKRIDFNLINGQEAGVIINYQLANLSKALLDEKGILFKDYEKGLSYKVQFVTSKQAYSGNLLSDFPDFVIENRPTNALNYYMVGLNRTYSQIEETLMIIRKKGISEAVVVPYINGWPITKTQAQQLTNLYPDLNTYLSAVK